MLSDKPNIGDVCRLGIDKAARRMSGEDTPIPTPFLRLNDMLGGGLWPGTLNVLIASPAAGKTQLAVQSARFAAERGCNTCYVSLEVEREQIALRMMSHVTGVPWGKMYTGRASGQDLKNSARCVDNHMDRLPIWIVEGNLDGMNEKGIKSLIDRLDAMPGNNPRLLCVDYLQVLANSGDAESVRIAVSSNAKAIKRAIKGTKVAALIISSAGRSKTAIDGKEPDLQKLMEAGKESGEIEFTSDLQMVIFKIKSKNEDGDEMEAQTALAIPKNRIGETGWFLLNFKDGGFVEL